MQSIKNLPVGSLIRDNSSAYGGNSILWRVASINHQGYPDNSVTLVMETALTGHEFDCKEPSSADTNQKSYGNNRYSQSNIRQWLNSSALAGGWYTAQSGSDDNTNCTYKTEAGFMSNFSTAFLNAVLPTTIQCQVPGGTTFETVIDKFFLPSSTEMGYTMTLGETTLDLYTSAVAGSNLNIYRTSYNVAGSAYYAWTRSPYSPSTNKYQPISYKAADSAPSSANTTSVYLRPLTNISGDAQVSVIQNDNGEFLFNSDGFPSPLWPDGANSIGKDIHIQFMDSPEWRAAITEVSVNGTTIDPSFYSTTTPEFIVIKASVFPTIGNYTITFTADGFPTMSVIQVIAATAWFNGGNGRANNPLQIATFSQLINLQEVLNKANVCAKIVNDITCDVQYSSIGTATGKTGIFMGVLDGQGHIIKGLTGTNNVNYISLFNSIKNATIKNITLKDLNFVMSGVSNTQKVCVLVSTAVNSNISGIKVLGGKIGISSSIVGGNQLSLGAIICGELDATTVISRCCVENVDAAAQKAIASIAGTAYGTITECYARNYNATCDGGWGGIVNILAGSPALLQNSFFIGSLAAGSDGYYNGGLAGENRSGATIRNCYAIFTMSGGRAGASWSCPTAGARAGAMVNIYYCKDAWELAAGVSSAGIGLSISEMMEQKFFSGFDFANIWGIEEGNSYPYLQWNPIAEDIFTANCIVNITDGSSPIQGALVNTTVNNQVLTLATDDAGCVSFNNIPEGNYIFTVTAYGYYPGTIYNISLVAGQIATLNLRLMVHSG